MYGEKKRGKKRFMADSVHLVERHRSIWREGGKEWRVTMAGFPLLFRLLVGIRPWMYGTGRIEDSRERERGEEINVTPIRFFLQVRKKKMPSIHNFINSIVKKIEC